MTNKERRAKLKAKKKAAREGLPKYYHQDIENVSAGGIAYYKLRHTRPRPFFLNLHLLHGYKWVMAKLGLE